MGGKREALKLSEKGGKRLEQSINCYYRLHRDILKPKLDVAYASHQDECKVGNKPVLPHTTFKNKFLSERFKEETDELRKSVLDARRKRSDVEPKDLKWADADEIDEEEANRRLRAYTLNT